jgi:predicted histidine transporter YuiF (NhaC family)
MNSSDCPESERMKNGVCQSLKAAQKSLLVLVFGFGFGLGLGLLQKYRRRREAEEEEGEEGEDGAHVEQKQISRTTNLKLNKLF